MCELKKQSVSSVLPRLQRQQDCPTCSLDVISGASAAWPNPRQPAKVYKDCFPWRIAFSCFPAVFYKSTSPATTRAPHPPLPGQNQAAGQPLISRVITTRVALSPCKKSCTYFLTEAQFYTSPLYILMCL